MEALHKIFFGLAGLFFVLGLFFYFGKSFGIGKLPGDISIKGESFQFHFPIVTCILISVVLSGVMWLVNYFRS